MNRKKNAPWLQALYAMVPLCISYIPVGLACEVLLQKVGSDPLLSGLLSILVFSSGAQFLVASMLMTQVSFVATLLMVLFLGLRYILLGASFAGLMKKGERMFSAIFSQSLSDENYTVSYLRLSAGPSWNKREALYVNWFSMAVWAGSGMIGNFFGSVIRVDADLVHFILTAMFIFIFVMQMKNALLVFTSLFLGVLGVIFMVLFQNTFSLIAATVIASFAGFILEKAFEKEKAKELRDHGKDVNEPFFNFSKQEASYHD